MRNIFKWGSVDHQKELAKSIGYDPKNWDASEAEANKLFRICVKAQISGRDKTGKLLSYDDITLLHEITGR